MMIKALRARNAGPAVVFPWPRPMFLSSVNPPYDNADLPYPVRRKNLVVCITKRSTSMASHKTPQLWSGMPAGGWAT